MKKKISSRILLQIFSILFIVAAIILMIPDYRLAQEHECIFSEGTKIGGVSVSGLDISTARNKLEALYESPVILKIDQTEIQLYPGDFGVHVDFNAMLEEAAASCSSLTTWQRFWKILWNQPIEGFKSVELIFNIDEELMQNFIKSELADRYNVSAIEPESVPDSTEFKTGLPGKTIDQKKLIVDLRQAFISPISRVVTAQFTETAVSKPDLAMIEGKLKDLIRLSEFGGVIAISLQPLPGEDSINFAVQNNNDIDPNIAFTAASTMKIPIMVSTFWRENLPLPEIVEGWLNHMIILSENAPADRLMENIDPVRGPLIVTEDMQLLGLENTFIAGYFYLGSPLLKLYQTPANSRTDINLDPDLYNQTTAQESGKLLSDIYTCSRSGNGLLVDKSDGSISMQECQMMIDILSQNQIGALIEAGLPEGTQIAHKHGWSEEQDGLLHTVSDAAIVFGPEKDFVFTIFVYSPNQLLFDEANFLIAKLAQAAFNGLNPEHQIPWIFDNQ